MLFSLQGQNSILIIIFFLFDRQNCRSSIRCTFYLDSNFFDNCAYYKFKSSHLS